MIIKSLTMKQWVLSICIVFFLITQWGITLPVSFLWLKYIAFTSALFLMSAMLTQRLVHSLSITIMGKWLRRMTISIVLLYDWICLDTFLLGMKLPIPGMIRYAIFDFTLPFSLLFVITGFLYGLCASAHHDTKDQSYIGKNGIC